jgi:hypothetical protein
MMMIDIWLMKGVIAIGPVARSDRGVSTATATDGGSFFRCAFLACGVGCGMEGVCCFWWHAWVRNADGGAEELCVSVDALTFFLLCLNVAFYFGRRLIFYS